MLRARPAQVEVRATACRRQNPVVAARAECRACADECPQGAIGLHPTTIDPSACDGCEACVPACPAAALATAAPERRALVTGLRTAQLGGAFHFRCERAPDPTGGPAHVLPCLSSLSPELMVATAVLGASPVALVTGECSGCPMEGTRAAVDSRQALAADVARALGVGPIQPPVTAADAPRPAMSRRGLLRGLLRRGEGAAQSLGESLVEAAAQRLGGAQDRTAPPAWHRRLLAAALRVRFPEGDLPDVIWPTPAPRVSADRCDGCGLCAVACPTDALGVERDGSTRLTLDPLTCVGCGSCDAACPRDALDLDGRGSTRAWLAARRVLATVVAPRCSECGAEALSADVPWCARCYRTVRPAWVRPPRKEGAEAPERRA